MMHRQHIQVDGARLYCRMEGLHDAPAVILHHSLATSLRSWDSIAPALAAHYHLIRFDARGHGRSDVPEGPYDLAQLAEDVVRLMDQLEINRAHFVGLSMGGMVGQHLGLDHGDRIRSLTLASTTAVMPPEAGPMWDQRIERARNVGMEALVDETIGRWFTAGFVAARDLAIEPIAQMIADTPPEGFAGWGGAIKKLNTLERLPQITVPTLVMVGREDPGTTVDAAEAIHSRIPGSHLHIIENASHQAPVEQPEEFAETLKAFLDEVK